MCGLLASVSYRPCSREFDERTFRATLDTMARRGPDAAGVWRSIDGQVILGHRRLAIIDLDSSADQPMVDGDGLGAIVFNGEIYNFQELRRELEERGCRFRTQSDTEVILQLYLRDGPGCVEVLRGMFAFAIWDSRDQSLFLARDPMGIKPIYYLDDGAQFIVASQVRTLCSFRDNLTPDPSGHLGFFLNGYVPDPLTMFKEIKAVPAGSWLKRSPTAKHEQKYYCVYDVAVRALETPRTFSMAERRQRISQALRSSVAAHMIADVDVGLFLSSGVDSCALGWLAAERAGSRLSAITLGAEVFRGSGYDEVPLAADFARRAGLQHSASYLTADDLQERLSDIMGSMDQPSIDGLNTYFVSQAASETGLKVVLSGLGGDELFRGYPSFKDVGHLVSFGRVLGRSPRLGCWVRKVSAPTLSKFTSPKFASIFEFSDCWAAAYFLRRALFLPWELECAAGASAMRAAWEEVAAEMFRLGNLEGIRSPGAKVSVLETSKYMRGQLLRDADWAGMAWSLEIRVPFVDSLLFSELAPLVFGDHGITKNEMIDALSLRYGEEIPKRPKQGFFLPINQWLVEMNYNSSRGLRGWANFVYKKWCTENNCEGVIHSIHD